MPSAARILNTLTARLARQVHRLDLRSGAAGTAGDRPGNVPRLVSLSLALPELPTPAPRLSGPQFQLIRSHGETLGSGFGSLAEWEASGPERLQTLARVARALSAGWQRSDPDRTGLDAFAMLGFAASPDAAPSADDHLPNALLWVPEVGVRACNGEAAIVLSAELPTTPTALIARWTGTLERIIPALYPSELTPLPPAQLSREILDPRRCGWSELVDASLADIRGGSLEKLVLARRMEVRGPRRFDIPRLLAILGHAFPSTQIIHLRRNGTSFVAATPERLLCQRGRSLEVDAIAGTAARGGTKTLDAALASQLFQSEKNLYEHRIVVAAIRGALNGCCAGIEVPGAPGLMQLNNAMHLWSPIRAQLRNGTNLFQLAERLHPTPATNGHPRGPAMQWLQNHESFQRGWYTGAAGILDPDLTGELWVLLRCARIRGDRAELFAGAGIVPGSDAETEWAETEVKLSAMLSALRLA